MTKKKVILSTIALLLVMFVAVSAVSYSIATKGHGDSNKGDEIVDSSLTNLAADAGAGYITNIDLIIDNAVTNNEKFNVVEIVPNGVDASDLKTYVENDGFAKYVISANKSTATEDMPSGMVNYELLTVRQNTTLTDTFGSGTVQDVLDKADLIYLSSPAYNSYDGTNNMSEEIFNYLHVYALGNNKPIIVDYVTSATTAATAKTYFNLVNSISRNHIKFRTYSWTAGLSAADFFTANGSYYLKYNVNNRKTAATGKVLILTASSTAEKPQAGSIYEQMVNAGDDVIIKNAYYGLTAKKPTEMSYTVVNVSTTALTAADFDTEYDFIVIENDIKNMTVPDDVYTKIRALSESSKYIFYDSRTVADTSSGTIDTSANNYLKLLSMLVSDKGVEKVSNALAISYGFFTSLDEQGASGVDGAKSIADLINDTIYRDSDTTGAAGKKFRVLEIQPCYPIDMELAESNTLTLTKYPGSTGIKGGYYTLPDQVLYGVTKEEIEEGLEYYNFEVSKAKIAEATGKPYNQIEIVQMSTNQLISTKEVVLENFDLVYIGGDTSALVPYTAVNYGGDSGFTFSSDSNYSNILKGFTSFDMYTHTGHFIDYRMSYYSVSGGTNSVTTNGNDLNTIKRDELKNYVKSGLPIIVDKVVTDAFEESYQYDKKNEDAKTPSRLKQLGLRNIDPDCNMYQFLAFTYELVKDDKASNVGWGMIDSSYSEDKADDLHNDEEKIENVDRMYGNTLGSTVTVYDETCSENIGNLIELSKDRPKLSVTEFPKEYIEGNASTTNTSATASFTASVENGGTSTTTGSYTVTLYVDANGDGFYSEEEEIDSASCSSGGSVDLSYQLDEDFFGLVNWKILAVDPNGVLCDMKSGCSFFKVTEDMKKTVRVLQLMPVDTPTADQDCISDGHSLYFCTECQQSTKLIKNNVTVNSNDNGGHGVNSELDKETVWGDVTLGKHEHDFGIVIYDSTTRMDDWETNFADELTHGASGTLEDGDYEFDLDILTVSEFDELTEAAASRSEDEVEAAAALADTQLVDYEEAKDDPALTPLREALERELFKAVVSMNSAANIGKNVLYRDVVTKGIGTAEEPGLWIIDQDYYKFWTYINDSCQTDSNAVTGSFDMAAVKTAYNNYITAYDKVVEKKELYKTTVRQAGDADTWLLNNYDIIVLGLADMFNYKDLSVESCSQLKTYVDKGGSILNSHDTLTSESSKGAVNLTDNLRATFGMDRFHVVDFNQSTSVMLKAAVAAEQTIVFGRKIEQSGNREGAKEITISNRDVTITLPKPADGEALDFNNAKITYSDDVHASLNENVKVTIKFEFTHNEFARTFTYYDTSLPANNGGSYQTKQGHEINGDTYTIEFKQKTGYVSDSFSIGESNVQAIFDISGGTVTAENASSEVAADGTLQVSVLVTENAAAVADGKQVVCVFRGNELLATTAGGRVTFIIDPTQESTESLFVGPTAEGASKYRKYCTKDNSKYFWTERLQAATSADYASVIAARNLSSYVHYNAPVGLTDLYATYNTIDQAVSPYKYVMTSNESFEHAANVNGINYEAKYGTRKAERVNKGGVTMYPFAISSELMISPTHSQTFALDLEDPTVAVWYTMGANYVDSRLSVTAQFARYSSAFYAASPKDGMSNYFLYSKDNVFYTGAGHQLVTGMNKENNDERRLFINVIVNSVTKGVTGPKLKLYNKCDQAGNDHENCDCLYVDPKNAEDNEKLSKNLNTLFYNQAIDMYQYNIDESQIDIYPEFDFKAIAGTADIKAMEVFYDLNYGEGDGLDKSDSYLDDDNHVLIASFDKSDNVDGKRIRLRETTYEDTLILKEDYFKNNKSATYIVIRVKDEKNKWKSARVKINIIPHLFDLTDADTKNVSIKTSDVAYINKKQVRA